MCAFPIMQWMNELVDLSQWNIIPSWLYVRLVTSTKKKYSKNTIFRIQAILLLMKRPDCCVPAWQSGTFIYQFGS